METKLNCVYLHINPIKQEPFYVGIGNYKRPFRKCSKSSFWYKVVNKYGYEVVIIHENLTWEEACELEKKYIAQIGRRDLGLGPLVNLTDGGEGIKNKKVTEDTKRKMSLAAKGKLKSAETKENMRKAQTGKKLSEETKRKVGLLSKGRNVGRIVSEETREKLRIARKNRKPYSEATRLKMSLTHIARNKRLKEEQLVVGSETRKTCSPHRISQ